MADVIVSLPMEVRVTRTLVRAKSIHTFRSIKIQLVSYISPCQFPEFRFRAFSQIFETFVDVNANFIPLFMQPESSRAGAEVAAFCVEALRWRLAKMRSLLTLVNVFAVVSVARKTRKAFADCAVLKTNCISRAFTACLISDAGVVFLYSFPTK